MDPTASAREWKIRIRTPATGRGVTGTDRSPANSDRRF